MVQHLSRIIKYSANVTGILASVSLLLNLCYEAVFYLPLDLTFKEMPTTLSDYIRGAINWIPAVTLTYGFGTYLGAQIMSVSVKNKTGKIIVDGKLILGIITKVIYGSSFLILIVNFLFGEKLIPDVAIRTSIYFVALSFFTDAIKAMQSIEPRQKGTLILLCTAFITILYRGYSEGINAKEGRFITYSKIYLRLNPQAIDASILRFYDKFIMVRYKQSGSVVFLPVSDLAKVESNKEETPNWKGLF